MLFLKVSMGYVVIAVYYSFQYSWLTSVMEGHIFGGVVFITHSAFFSKWLSMIGVLLTVSGTYLLEVGTQDSIV